MVGDYGYVKDESVRDLFGQTKDYKWLIENYTNWFLNSYTIGLYGPDGGVCYALKRNSIIVDAAGTIRKCTCDLDCEENSFGSIEKDFDIRKHEEWLHSRRIKPDSACYLCKRRPLCHNRQCYEAKECLSNYMFMDSILECMSEKQDNYNVINGGVLDA